MQNICQVGMIEVPNNRCNFFSAIKICVKIERKPKNAIFNLYRDSLPHKQEYGENEYISVETHPKSTLRSRGFPSNYLLLQKN